MSVLFHDIHEETHEKIWGKRLDYFNWWELICADDTMLVGHRARDINMLLSYRKNIGQIKPQTQL